MSGAGRTLIVGLGVTGLSCARFLLNEGGEVAITDSRENPPALAEAQQRYPDVPMFVGGFEPAAFARAERIIVSPGVSLSEPLLVAARARGVEVIGDIELFARVADAPVVTITGSNGKSTVTTLVGAMARRAGLDVRVGGNLGTPALDLIEEHEPDLYVLELSSFQLETVHSLRAQAAVVLNISADHLDRYASLQAYADAKRQVYRHAKVCVVNRDDAIAAALASGQGDTVGFTLQSPQGLDFGLLNTETATWLARGSERLLPVGEVCMRGHHNLANALAALALGDASGIPMPAMLQTLREFRGLEHRTQWVGKYQGVDWFNDSKATNIGAALAAVHGLGGPLVLIAGGQGKGADFAELASGLSANVRAVVVLGEAAEEIEHALAGQVDTFRAADMRAAVRQAAKLASQGGSVLLSPACASFDMFSGYQQRGDVFMQAVRELES